MASSKTRNYIIIGIICALLFGATIVLLKPKDHSYQGFSFAQAPCPSGKDECWYTELAVKNQMRSITFYYHPAEVEDIPVPREVLLLPKLADITNHTLYLAIPKNAPGKIAVAGVQVARIVGIKNDVLNINTKSAIYGTGPEEVSCANANGRTVIISFESGPTDEVFIREKNCIILQATTEERAVAVAEAFTYHLLGIIPTYSYQYPTNEGKINGTLLQ